MTHLLNSYSSIMLAILPTIAFFLFLYLDCKKKSFNKALAKAAAFSLVFVLLNTSKSIKYFIILLCINSVVILITLLVHKLYTARKI